MTTTKRKRVARCAASPALPSNIEANPAGAVLILPAAPKSQSSSIAVLLKADGTAVALRALSHGDGRWELPELAGHAATPTEARSAVNAFRKLRNGAEAEVERLIALLDQLDGDTDVEPQGDDEPSLGGAERHGAGWSNEPGHCDDLEEEHDGSEPDVDGEPSLCGITADEISIDDQDCEDDDES